MDILYKVLVEEHLEMYRNLRLELLKSNPTNFGSSYEEESQFDNNRFLQRLHNPKATNFGVFDNEELVGMCVVVRNPRKKMKHRVILNSMYIKPEYRGKGISNGLLEYVFANLNKNDVEMICLTVVNTNTPAISLYKKLGFIEDGIEKSAIKYNGTYYDLLWMHKYLDAYEGNR